MLASHVSLAGEFCSSRTPCPPDTPAQQQDTGKGSAAITFPRGDLISLRKCARAAFLMPSSTRPTHNSSASQTPSDVSLCDQKPLSAQLRRRVNETRPSMQGGRARSPRVTSWQPSLQCPKYASHICPCNAPGLSYNRVADDLVTAHGRPRPTRRHPATPVTAACQVAQKALLTGGACAVCMLSFVVTPPPNFLYQLATPPAVHILQHEVEKLDGLAPGRAMCLTPAASCPGSHVSQKSALCSDQPCKTEKQGLNFATATCMDRWRPVGLALHVSAEARSSNCLWD